MDGLLDFSGIEDVAPLDMPDISAVADVVDAAPIDDALQAAYTDWLGEGNEGTIQDFLTTQETPDIAPVAFAGQTLESIGDFKPGEIVGLDRAAFAPEASLGGNFGSGAPFGGSFAGPVGESLPRPDVGALAFNDRSFADSPPASFGRVGFDQAFSAPVAPTAPFGGGASPSLPPVQPLDAPAASLDQAGNRRMPSFMEPGYADGFSATKPQEPTAPANSFASMFAEAEKARGLPSGYLARVAKVESGMNPNAQNPRSSAGGLFQFINSTARQYGLQDRFDPKQATDAAARLAADNKAILTRTLGREPTAGELYLAHQQGGGGAVRLLSNPDARAADIVGRQAVVLNGGTPSMSAGDFASKWTSKVDNLDAPGAFRAAAARQVASSRPAPVLPARDPSQWGTPTTETSAPAPSPRPAPTPSISAPQGRPTMQQITPDEELYSLGMIRDPAGGGMIENVAIRPPGMVAGPDGAYVEGTAPAAPPAFGGGFGGIASGIRSALGMDAPSAAPAPQRGGNDGQLFTLPPKFDAWLGGISAALMAGNGAAFAPTYEALLASSTRQAETAADRNAIALVLQKQGLPAEEAQLFARSPQAAKMALDTIQQQREAAQLEAVNQSVGTIRQPPASPSAPAPQAQAPVAPAAPAPAQSPADIRQNIEGQRQGLLNQLDQLNTMKGRLKSNLHGPIDAQINTINARLKALDAAKPEPDNFQPIKDDAGNIIGRFNARTGTIEPVGGATVPVLAPKAEREVTGRESAADRLGLQGEERKFFLANGRVPTAGEKLTETQSKDVLFYKRAKEALTTLESPLDPKNPNGPTIADAMASPKDRLASGIPGIGNFLTSEQYQKAQQAGDDFMTAALRKDTGAAFTAEEKATYNKMFLPQPGDGPEVLRQKAQVRRTFLEGLRSGVGPTGENVIAKGEGAKSSMEGKTAINPTTGERRVYKNGQWVPAQ